jgi:hypothetical protein
MDEGRGYERKDRVEFQRASPLVTSVNVWCMSAILILRGVNLLEGKGSTSKKNTELIVKYGKEIYVDMKSAIQKYINTFHSKDLGQNTNIFLTI